MHGSIGKELFVAVAVAILATWLLPFLVDRFTLTVLIVYSMLAFSLGLVWGFGGVLCFGQAAFYGLGAYAYAVSAANIGESTVPMLIAVAFTGAEIATYQIVALVIIAAGLYGLLWAGRHGRKVAGSS